MRVAAAGTLDISAAAIYYAGAAPTRVMRLPQGIASGVLGSGSFSGGLETAALGLTLHCRDECDRGLHCRPRYVLLMLLRIFATVNDPSDLAVTAIAWPLHSADGSRFAIMSSLAL